MKRILVGLLILFTLFFVPASADNIQEPNIIERHWSVHARWAVQCVAVTGSRSCFMRSGVESLGHPRPTFAEFQHWFHSDFGPRNQRTYVITNQIRYDSGEHYHFVSFDGEGFGSVKVDVDHFDCKQASTYCFVKSVFLLPIELLLAQSSELNVVIPEKPFAVEGNQYNATDLKVDMTGYCYAYQKGFKWVHPQAALPDHIFNCLQRQ